MFTSFSDVAHNLPDAQIDTFKVRRQCFRSAILSGPQQMIGFCAVEQAIYLAAEAPFVRSMHGKRRSYGGIWLAGITGLVHLYLVFLAIVSLTYGYLNEVCPSTEWCTKAVDRPSGSHCFLLCDDGKQQ